MAFLNYKPSRKDKRQRGVGMIEVLVSITISAFALLGLAGLQVASLRYQKVANFRSLASQYAADMADRIRANASAVTTSATSANYATYDTSSDQYSTSPPSTVPSCAAAVSVCANPQAVATKDIYDWRVALNTSLAGGWGTITQPAANPLNLTNPITITIYYNEPDKKLGGTTDPNCVASVLPSGVDATAIRCFTTTVLP
jgi:type IV pilus assembly protein PilV